jgi:CheY-like chemotaxis protein
MAIEGEIMPYTALIVEDDPTLRLIYRQVLSKMDFEVVEATNGAQALNILQEQTPHILFLDMLLPHVNGETILDYVRSSPHHKSTLIVVATAHNQYAETFHEDPDVEFVLKPISPREIRTLAQQAIDRITG